MKRLFPLVFMVTALCATLSYAQLFGTDNEPKKHHDQAGITCIDCHGTDDPLDGVEEPKCLECHGDREDIASSTSEVDPNPHFGHEDGMSCKRCHREHEPSILYCDECHKWGYTTP